MKASDYYFNDYEPEYLDGNLSMSREDAFKFAESFADEKIKEEIEKAYDQGRKDGVAFKRMKDPEGLKEHYLKTRLQELKQKWKE